MNKVTVIILITIIAIAGIFLFKNLTGQTIENQSELTIKVSIPCEGHVSLISSELKKLDGVSTVTYLGAFKFKINYDSAKISKEKILNAEIFKEYSAKEIK
jgi:copper chaperone CopZ